MWKYWIKIVLFSLFFEGAQGALTEEERLNKLRPSAIVSCEVEEVPLKTLSTPWWDSTVVKWVIPVGAVFVSLAVALYKITSVMGSHPGGMASPVEPH